MTINHGPTWGDRLGLAHAAREWTTDKIDSDSAINLARNLRQADGIEILVGCRMLGVCVRLVRLRVGTKGVDLDQGHAGGGVRAAHNRGVGAWLQRCNDGRFFVVYRRDGGVDDLLLLSRPANCRYGRSASRRCCAVPGPDQPTSGYPSVRREGPMARTSTLVGCGATDDKSTNHDVVSKPDFAAGGDVTHTGGSLAKDRRARTRRRRCVPSSPRSTAV